MSTASTAVPAGPAGPASPVGAGEGAGRGGPSPSDDPAERGRLDIAERVVEKVAGHAVTLVPSASAAPRRILGRNVGDARDDARADVQARVYGDVAAVMASLSVAWPRSVVEVADQVRDTVRREVERITGVRVDYVDIEIPAMSHTPSGPGRVE